MISRRPLKRTISVTIPDTPFTKVARKSATKYTKKKDKTLLSGHTNTDNKKLTWSVKQLQISTPSGTPFHKAIRANSPYDPDPALGGESAYGFDIMAGRWDKYYVKGAKMSLITSGYNQTKIQPLVLMWADTQPGADLPNLNTAVGICKANGGKMWQMGHVLGNQKPIPGIEVKTKDVHRGGIGDEDNSSTVNNNPLNPMYFHIAIFNIGTLDLDNSMDCNAAVSVEYDVMFYDPKDNF